MTDEPIIKRADQIAKGDVLVWGGSLAGAEVIDAWNGEGFTIRWVSTIDGSYGSLHEAYLTWAADSFVNLQGAT